jgi:hypothetical protein
MEERSSTRHVRLMSSDKLLNVFRTDGTSLIAGKQIAIKIPPPTGTLYYNYNGVFHGFACSPGC